MLSTEQTRALARLFKTATRSGATLLAAEAPHPLDADEPLPGAVVEVAMVMAVVGVVAGRAAIRARLPRGLAAPLGVA